LDFSVSGLFAVEAFGADCVEFVDEDYCGGFFLGKGEGIAD